MVLGGSRCCDIHHISHRRCNERLKRSTSDSNGTTLQQNLDRWIVHIDNIWMGIYDW